MSRTRDQSQRVYPERPSTSSTADDEQLKYIKWEGNLYLNINGKMVSHLVQVYRHQIVCLSSSGAKSLNIKDIVKIVRLLEEDNDIQKFKCEIKMSDKSVIFASPKEHVLIDFIKILSKMVVLKDKLAEKGIMNDGSSNASTSKDDSKHIKWEGNLYLIAGGKPILHLVQVYKTDLLCLSSAGTKSVSITDIVKITRLLEDDAQIQKFNCEVKTKSGTIIFASPKEHVLVDFVSILSRMVVIRDKMTEKGIMDDSHLPQIDRRTSDIHSIYVPKSKKKVVLEDLDQSGLARILVSKDLSSRDLGNQMELGHLGRPIKRDPRLLRVKDNSNNKMFSVGSLEDLQADDEIKTSVLKTGPRQRRRIDDEIIENPRARLLEKQRDERAGRLGDKKVSASERRLHDLIATHLVQPKDKIEESLEDFYEPSTIKEQLEFITTIDFKFVASIFNLKPFFIPVTRRKIFLYVLYAFVGVFLSGFTLLPSAYELLSRFCSINASLLLVQFLMIDPSVVLACVLLCRYPPLPKKQRTNKENPTIALVITCHKSADAIIQTLKAALVHLEPQNIFIADNGNQKEPLDNTLELIKKLDPRLNYRWNNIGNKTLAQFLAVRQIDKERKDIKHIMIIDDDVTISPHLRFPVERIEGNTKALVIGIRGVDGKGKQRVLWTKWQDMEYKVSDFVKIFQDQYCSVMYPHGAISLWDKSILLQILIDHDSVFYADDVKMGMWLTRRGYRLGYYADAVVNTETPDTIFGPAPNYYNQRVRSWDFAEHMLTWRYIKCLAFGYIRGNPLQTLLLKFFQLYSLYTNLIDWLKIPGIVFYLTHEPAIFGITFTSMLFLNTCSILAWNYISCRNRPDIRISITTILTFPIYKLISSIIRIISVFRCALVYWPRFKPKLDRPKLLSEEKIKDIESWMEKHK